MLNKMKKGSKIKRFGSEKKRGEEMNPSAKIRPRHPPDHSLSLSFLFFSLLAQTIFFFSLHLHHLPPPSILFFSPSFFVLSLHWVLALCQISALAWLWLMPDSDISSFVPSFLIVDYISKVLGVILNSGLFFC